MNSSIYAQARTPVQNFYYDARSRQRLDFEFFPNRDGKLSDFLARYVLMNEVHKRLHPFQFVRPGDTVVHVGFDRVYLNKGQSHPLVLSALVGEQGRVVAMDPDPRNTGAITDYAQKNGISNLKTVNNAVWKEAATLKFIFDAEWSPMSVATNVMGSSKKGEQEYKPGEGSTTAMVEAKTLDDLIAQHLPDRKVTYLSLTANGAEPEIVEGAKKLLQTPDLRIGIALAFRHFSYAIRKDVCNTLVKSGYKIAVADAPHDPWIPQPFYFACALKASDEELAALGFHPSSWDAIEAEGAVKEAAIAAAKAKVKPPKLGVRVARRLAREFNSIADGMAKSPKP